MLAFPMQAWGYSYGDPTKEDIAETFVLIQSKINASTPDWKSAQAAYEVRRAEISSHFGESIAVTLDANVEKQEKDLLFENYRYVLYLNLERRFIYAEADIDDYGKSKLLIGKAKGTFDVLKPYIQSKAPNEVSKLEEALEKTLKALGNPGLFGVGEEPVEPEVFKEQTAYILKTLKPHFPYTAKAKEQSATDQKNETPPAKTEAKDTKPTTSEPQGAKVNEETKATTDTKQDVKIASEQAEAEQASTENSAASEQPVEEGPDAATEQPIDNGAAEVEVEAAAAAEEEPADTTAALVEDAEAELMLAEHAPMDRTSKTNPVITFIVIGAIVLLGGGGIFLAKRKGII
jgi:hypothetical protein